MIIELKDGWNFISGNGKYKGEATLNTSNYFDLYKNDYISDPYYGTNSDSLLWVAQDKWIYKNSAIIEMDALTQSEIILHFDYIDTIADVYYNDKLLAKVDNAYIPYDFSVKDISVLGKNEIKVVIHSPLDYVKEQLKTHKIPPHENSLTGFACIRKPGCHFGWDWGPTLPVSGIGSARLIARKKIHIDDIIIRQEHTTDKVVLDVDIKVKGEGLASLKYTLHSPSDDRETFYARNVNDVYNAKITIDNPLLWYPNGSVPDRYVQPLYRLKVDLFIDNELSEEKEITFGLRELSLSTEKDEFGNDFCFIVNGKRIFAKGANWIPADSIRRISYKETEEYVKIMADSNYNMIRVWGGGLYATEDFFSLCDKYGILIWHDFMFACSPYPLYDKDYVENTLKEVKHIVTLARNHASLALWCGNNEIESISMSWFWRKDLLECAKTYFYETLPAAIRLYDNKTPYLQGSPVSGDEYLKGMGDDNKGDTHIWSVWHGLNPFEAYFERYTRFCSEFGFESLPSMDAVRSFSVPSEWDLKNPVMLSHQRCKSGNKKILYYLIKNYRVPVKFEHLIYLSQLTEANCIAVAVEHWRRNMGRCNGALYWQFNDCWPVSSWSSVDYTRKYKALQYLSKRFYAPLMISLVPQTREIYIINDTIEDFSGKLEWELIDFYGNRLFSGTVPADASAGTSNKLTDMPSFPGKLNRTVALFAYLYDKDGNKLLENSCIFVRDRNVSLIKTEIESRVTEEDDGILISLSAKAFVRQIMLDCEGISTPFDKNFFDMRPNTVYEVRIKDDRLLAENVSKQLKIYTMTDVVTQYSPRTEKLYLMKMDFHPKNLIRKIYYKLFM